MIFTTLLHVAALTASTASALGAGLSNGDGVIDLGSIRTTVTLEELNEEHGCNYGGQSWCPWEGQCRCSKGYEVDYGSGKCHYPVHDYERVKVTCAERERVICARPGAGNGKGACEFG